MIVEKEKNNIADAHIRSRGATSPIQDFITKKKRTRDSSHESKQRQDWSSDKDRLYYSDDEKEKVQYVNLNKKFTAVERENDKEKLRLIEPHRSLGLVVDHNAVHNFRRNTDRLLLASNYHSFLLYNLDKIKLERISPPLSNKITAITMYKNKVFTAVGAKILLWEKIHIVGEFSTGENKIEEYFYTKLVTFDNLLIASASNGEMHIFDIYKNKLVKSLSLQVDQFVHPSTYLNKILFTKTREQYEEDLDLSNAKIYLYNINTEKQIFEYDFGLKNGIQIKTIEQSPVIDIVGIGFSSGAVVVFNIKSLKKLITFKSEHPVNYLSFSNCPELNMSLLASGNPNGDINIWDLNKQSLHYTIKRQFTDVSSLSFLANEPILIVTSGKDNSIKMFRFELNSGTPTLLKQRTGHSTHPQKIRFYGETVNNESFHIISQTEKDLRNISILNEHMSREFSISFKNLPSEIRHEVKVDTNKGQSFNLLNFDFNEFRERDWSNLIVSMKGHSHPLLFSYENSTVTDTLTKIKSKSSCTSVCVSMCGNFGFAGFEDGSVEKFNMQSGLSKWTIEKAHENAVIGIKSDGINSMVISISLDGTVKFWELFQASLIKKITLSGVPQLLEINRDNDLIAISLLNSTVQLYDKATFKLVREFNHTNTQDKINSSKSAKINDITFSKDGKWLISVSDDKSLKIYDILSGNLIEWVTFKHIPLSVTISPNNQYIAISYVGLNGIYLWINRSLFVDLVDIEEVKSPIKFDLPFSNNYRTRKTRKEISEEEKQLEVESKVLLKSQPLKVFTHSENEKLVSLSSENRLKFRILNHLEKIQEKNMPKIKRKEKAKAPFFLFNINNEVNNNNPEEPSPEFMNILKNYTHFKNEKMVNGKNQSDDKELVLIELLELFAGKKVKSSEISAFLNSLNPYLIDLEIRNLDPLFALDLEANYLNIFLDFIAEEIHHKKNFELVQAYLNRFLKIYTDYSIKDKTVKSKLEIINKDIESCYRDIEFLYNNTMCLISHFGKIQI